MLDLKEHHVRELHTQLAKERGQVTANRAMQLLRCLFNFEHLAHNPASKAVTMYRERTRERFVQPEELPRFFKALDDIKTDPAMRDFFYLALYTGARRSLNRERWSSARALRG